MPRPQTPRRTQAERTRVSREKIIQAATELFAQQGFHGAKMADIAKAANLTVPGLLHHFPSKTSLLTAVLAERDRVDRERFTPNLSGDEENLLSSLHKLVRHNESVPGLVQLFTVLVAESIDEQHPGHEFFMRRYQNLRQQSLDALRQAQIRGEVRNDIPAEDLLVFVFALMDGLQIQWLYEPDKIKMSHLFKKFLMLLR
jgi:AcrR family transcriptional regulator